MPPKSRSALTITHRPSSTRGHFDKGWLRTFHSFSFDSYRDNAFPSFGPLAVINEDRVQASRGFGEHSHADFEIWSYIMKGELEHRDSMGNVEIMKAGDIQMTSAGSGISHSEFNRHPTKPCGRQHLLQIWCEPSQANLPPTYYNRHFTPASKRNMLLRVVAPVGSPEVTTERGGDGPVPIHAALTMHASILSSGSSLDHSLGPKTTKVYLHLAQTSGYRAPTTAPDGNGAQLRLNDDLVLEEGDAAMIVVGKKGARELRVESVGKKDAEWVLIEME